MHTVHPRHLVPTALLTLALTVLALTMWGCDEQHPGVDIAELEAGLDDLIHDDQHEHGFIGNGVSVRLADGRRLRTAVGHADPEGQTPYDLATTEQVVGSVTKVYTAVLVMQLVEEGRIGLDDPVDRWLTFAGSDDLTVRMLLSHTSGLAEYLDQLTPAELGQPWAPRDLLARALAAEPMGPPGLPKAIYSNTNYLVLALIVEAETDQSWQACVDQRIAGPLGLEHTYDAADPRAAHTAGGWLQTDDGWLDTLTVFDPSIGWGIGAMVTTNDELMRFATALWGGELFHDPATLAAMRTYAVEMDPAHLGPQPPAWMGLGLMVMDVEGVTLEGHLGHIAGYHAGAVRDPATGAIIVVTSNDDRAWAGLTALDVARYLRAR
jgi:D-alanyl-D-alanine carboxypeptidase